MNKPSTEHIKAAIEWHIYFSDAEETPEQHAGFQAWLTEHPLHQMAWQQVKHLHEKWQDMPLTSLVAPNQTISDLQNKNDLLATSKEYLALQSNKYHTLAAVLIMVSLGLGYFYVAQPAWLVAEHRTKEGEIKTVMLADGSRMMLNSDAAIRVQYTASERRIRLTQGEVIAEVAPDAARPFMIETEQMTARALGTVYAVKRLDDHTSVATVVESKVQVCTNDAPTTSTCTALTSNQQIAVSQHALQPMAPVDARAETAWQSKMIVADHMPLPELLAKLQANHPGWIRYDEQKLAHYAVSGVYALDDATETLKALQKSTPIRFKKLTNLLIIVY
ncbi:FecR domain-containing protein [Neisseriaceae bacterium CLB008]